MNFIPEQAIYSQIANLVCENILRHTWKEGDTAPSIREMAVNLQVNPNTVTRAYSFLQDKGIVEVKRGIGFLIPKGAYRKTLDLVKDAFIVNDLPNLKKKLSLIGLKPEDIMNYLR